MLLVLAVGTLLAVLGLLSGRAAAVCAGYILLFLGLGLHLPLVRVASFATPTEADATLQNLLEIVFSCHNTIFFAPDLTDGTDFSSLAPDLTDGTDFSSLASDYRTQGLFIWQRTNTDETDISFVRDSP